MRSFNTTKPSSTLPAVAVFARTPVPGTTKTRLMPVFGAQGAAELQGALISDTLRKVSTIEPLASLYVFFAGGSLPTGPRAGIRRTPAFGGDIPWSAGAFQPSVTVLRQRGRDLGERLEGAFRFLLRRHPAAVVIG